MSKVCDATNGDMRCVLPSGHEGAHATKQKTVTIRDVLEAVKDLESWRTYPEARADFISFVVGQPDSNLIAVQWTAFVYGWMCHKFARRGAIEKCMET